MKKRLLSLLLILCLALGCAFAEVLVEGDVAITDTLLVEYGQWYSAPDEVALYLHAFAELPFNYLTKSEARSLGWDSASGNLWDVAWGLSIGGDVFGNREGLLPEQTGRSYTECDINTDGADSRGAERLIFSNDGLYFYTSDHYASFTELTVDGGTVVWSR